MWGVRLLQLRCNDCAHAVARCLPLLCDSRSCIGGANLLVELVQEDFRSEVLHCANDALLVKSARRCGGAAGVQFVEVFGQSKVGENACPRGVDEDVAWLDVSVHKSRFVDCL